MEERKENTLKTNIVRQVVVFDRNERATKRPGTSALVLALNCTIVNNSLEVQIGEEWRDQERQ